MPTKEEFAKNMADPKYRKTLYEGLQAKGFKQPEYNAYESFWSKNTKPTTDEDLAKTFVMSPEWQEDYARGKEVENEIKAEDAKRKQTADSYNAYAKLEDSFAKYEQSQDVSDLFNVGQQEPIFGEDPKKYWRNRVAKRKEGEAQAKAKVDQEREELRQRMQLLKDDTDAWEKSLEQPLQTNAPEVGLRSMESFANGKPVDKRGNVHDNWVSKGMANQRIDAEDKARQLGMQSQELQDMLNDPMALDKEMTSLKAELAELTKQRDAYGSQFAKEHPWQMMANLMGRDSFDNPYEVGMYGVDAMETQKQMNNVIARINMLTEAKNAFERGSWSGHGFWNNVKNVGKGMAQFATEINSYTDKYNIESGIALNNLANKIERGEMLTDEEMSWFVTAKLKEEGEKAASQGPTTGAVGYGAPASLEYMVTMAINPARGASKTISDKIIEAGVRRFGKSAFTKMMAKATGMLTEGAVLSTTLGADNVASDALGRMAGKVGFDDGGNVAVADRVNPLKAMYQSTMASTIESAVEMMGVPIIGKATKGIGKVATKLADAMSYGKVSKLLSAMDKSQIVNWTKGMQKATGWHNLGEEWGEENVTMLANAIIVGDNEIADMFDTRTQLEILGTCALISGVMSTANIAGFAGEFHKVNREFKKAKQEVLRQFSSDVWASLDNLITNAQDEDLTVRLADAMDGMAMNQEQRSAIMNYLTALKRYQKFNELNDGGKFIIGGPQQAQATQSTSTSTYEIDSDITLKDEIGNPIDAHIVSRDANGNYMVESSQPINGKRVQPMSADQLDAMVIPNTPDGIQQSEVDGYNLTDANQQAEVSMLTDNARESVATLLGVTPDAVDVTLQQVLGDNPTDAKIDARFGDNAQVVKDYMYNVAKTKGMSARLIDDIADATTESDRAIDAVDNNGNVVTAKDAEGNDVNVVSGNIATYEDGLIDTNNSDSSVVIRHADGTTEMVAPTSLTEVVSMPTEQAKATQAQAIAQQMQQAFADAMSGALDYSQGQQYTMLNADGSTTDVTILADNGDGNVTVTARDGNKEGGVTDGKQIVLPKSQIQQGVREFKRNQLRGESAQQTSIPQAESQPTEVAEPAQEPSMPTDEQGNILYEQMDADSAWDALLAETGGDADMAMTVANEMIADKTKAVEEASKMVAQPGATPQEKIANLKAVKQAQAQAQAELDAWKAIAETPTRRMSLQAEQAEQTESQGQQVADKLSASEEVTTETPTESESTPQVGLVEDTRTRTLGDKTRKMLDAMAKRLGLQVEFVDEVNGGKANADIVGNKVRIAWDKRDQALDFLLGHEFTHRMQDLSPEAYAEFVEATKQALGEEEWNKRINRMKSLYKQHGINISEQGIIDEVVADYTGELVEERGVFDNFVERNKDNRGLLSRIADVLKSIKEFFTLGKQRKINNAIARLEALIESASEVVTSVADVAETDSEIPRFNLATEGEVATKLRDFVESKEGRALGWTQEQMEQMINETEWLINSIDSALQGDTNYEEWRERKPTITTDWRDGETKPTVTWSRGNIEYKYDMSADLLCINNEGLESVLSSPIMAELMTKAMPNFTSNDYSTLYQVLKDKGFVVPCAGCFDFAMRLKMLPSVAQKFVQLTNEVIDERNKNPEAFDEMIRQRAKEGKQTVEGLPISASDKKKAIELAVVGDNLTEHLDWHDFLSAEGQTEILSKYGGLFRAWQRTGAGRPKDKLLPEPWIGEMASPRIGTIIAPLDAKTPSYRADDVNVGTGLRRNSHSEYRPALVVDEIQMMREAFVKNLLVFKYMKELDDVRMFGELGVKYNMSFFPAFDPNGVAAGLDANGEYIASEESVGAREFEYTDADGKIHYDGMKGRDEALKYTNENVSLSAVAFSVPHLIKLMTDVPTPQKPDGWVGSIIGYHAGGATASQMAKQGLGKARAASPDASKGAFEVEAMTDYNKGVTNFEQVQNDRFGEGWVVVEGKKAGEKVSKGHKLEFVNGKHYYNESLGVHLFSNGYVYDSELPNGKVTADIKKNPPHPLTIDYNDKVRELNSDYGYMEASDYYTEELHKIGMIPRFEFVVPEDIFLQMCADAKRSPYDPNLGWEGKGHDWNPSDAPAYYALWCDYGMTVPGTGKWSPHRPVGYIDAYGNRSFRLPENVVDIAKDAMSRYTDRRNRENAMTNDAIVEFCKRSIDLGAMDEKKAEDILNKNGFSLNDNPTPPQKTRFSLTGEEQSIIDEAKANGTYLKAPNGKASNLNERQWVQVRTKAFKDWFGDWENDPENASKVVDENGEPMVVYHGSYWNPLEEAEGKAVFDDSFRGTSSGDNGWFGRGHYFAFGNGKLSKAEARYYGPNVFDAFLNIRNPFMYAETIYKDYNPTNGKSEHNASLVAINTAKAFPNLVEDFQVEQFDGNGDKVDSISIKDYADIFDKIYKEKEFIVEESDEYPNVIIVKADPIEHTDEDLNISWVEYGWEMRMIAPAEREDKQFTFAHHYLTQEVYGREGHSFYILPDRDLKAFSESEEFTSILKERGYDGVLQSAIGDEAVAFEPTQIKSATDNVGTFDASNPDIRYSLFGGNSGYVGYSMSKRAARAREEGRYPKTDFRKEYGVTAKSFEELVDAKIIVSGEWHHTSMYGNETKFYHWDKDFYADIYEENKKQIDKLSRERKTNEIISLFENHPLELKAEYDNETEWLVRDVNREYSDKIREVENEKRDKEGAYNSAVFDALGQLTNVVKANNGNLWFNASNGVGIQIDSAGNEKSMNYSNANEGNSRDALRAEARNELQTAIENIVKEGNIESVDATYYTDKVNQLEAERAERVAQLVEAREKEYTPKARYSLASDMARDAVMTALEGAGIDVEMATPEMAEDVLRARDAEFHIAYHGSGAKFDEFDHSHMGEGEGAQAYGWGTYLTEVEGIAKMYAGANGATMLTYKGNELDTDGLLNQWRVIKDLYDENKGRLREMRNRAERILSLVEEDNTEMKQLWQSVVDTLKQVRAGDLKVKPKRNLYTVEIPDDTGKNYLDYDKEMSKKELNEVRNKLEAILAEGDYKGVEKELKRELDSVFVDGLTASDVYGNVSAYLGGDKQASEFFNEMGYVGIKYPANYRSGGNEDGKKNFVIFNDSDMKITDRVEFLQTPDGTVYGWTIGGKVYLTEQGMNAETPIHEYTHLWANAMRRNNEQGWESVKDLLRGTPMWDEVLADKNYSNIHDNEDLVASEVLSRYSGKENAKRLEDEAQRMISEAKGIGAKADAVSLIDRVRRALQKFWDWVGKDLFGIKDFDNIEQVTDRVLYDLMNHTDLNAEVSEGESQQMRYSLRTKPEPKKTIKVYKLFNVDENGNPQALFIDAANSLEVGVWYDADSPTIKDLEGLETEWSYLLDNEGDVVDKKPLKRGKGGNFVGLPSKADVNKATQEGQRWMTVSTSKSGEKAYHTVGINGAGGVSTYALRPGWHATNVPSARHIGVGKDGANAKYRGANQRWFEIEISADVDYNEEARERYLKAHPNYSREKAYSDLKGDIPERIPEDGYYNFKTNSNANPNQDWYIAGAIKIVRPLTEEEGRKISRSKGIAEDLPYKDGVKNFDEDDKKTSISERSGAVSGNSSSDGLLEKSNEHLSRYPLTTNQDTAKLQQNSQAAIASAQKVINKGGFDKAINSPNDAVRELGKALKMEKSKSSMSYYGDFYEGIFYADGKTLKLRVSTHPANGARIGNEDADDKISIVIYKDGEHVSTGEHNGYTEYVYEPSEISPNDAAMSILKSVKTLLEEGEFIDESNKAHGQNYPYIDNDGKVQYSLQGGRSIADKYEKKVNTKGKGGAMHLSKFNAQEAFQDEQLSLKEVQRIIEQEYGIVLESYEDAYMAENALSSVNQAEWERYIKDFYEPMMQIIDKWILKGGETEQSINHYLIAKSGLERNREFTVRDALAEMDKMDRQIINGAYSGTVLQLANALRQGQISQDEYNAQVQDAKDKKNQALENIKNAQQARVDAYRAERDALREQLKNGDISYEEFNKLSDEVALKHAKAEEIADYSGLTALAKQYNEKDWRNFAEQMVVNFENKHDNTDVLWERINNATKKAVEKSYESGITSKEAKNHLDQMFLWYVPMGGMENDTAEDIYSYLNRNADSAFTQTVKRAEGHSEHISDDVMAMIANTMQSAILQGNRNKMKQKFLNMVENYPTDLFTLDRGWVVMQGNEWVESHPEIKADYTAEQVRDAINAHNEEMRNLEEQGLAMSKEGALKLGIPLKNKRNEQEHAISVMRNGQKVTIYVNGNPRVAQALNGKLKDVEQTWIGKAYGKLKRYFSASKTSWNPDFVSSNFSRDIGYSTGVTFVKHGIGEWGRSVVMYAPAIATLVAKALGKKSPWGAKYDHYFDEFVRNGGVTGYSHLYSVDDWKIENTKRIDRLRGVAKAIKAHNNLWVNLGKVYNEINSIIENSSRFNEYARSRNRGEDVATSVWNAKEITLNFNKKGSSKTEGLFGGLAFLGRNLVPFFNPIMQGIYQFLKIGKEHKRRMTALCFGYMGMGFMQPFVNAMLVELLGGGDEDDYMKQPEYTRRTNFMLYTGDGYIKIPLAQIFREFYGIGDVVYCAMYGKLSEEDATSQAISQVRKIFSLDGVSTYFDWVADIATNTNFMGNPLWKENDYNKYKPEYTKAYDNTWSFLVSASKWLNEALGGDEHTAPEDFNGKWINPAIWQRILSELGGGALTSLLDVYDTASALVHGEDVDWANVPIAKRLYTETDEETLQKWIDKEYFSNLDNYKMVRDRMSSLKSSNALDVAEKIDFMYHDPKYLEYVIFDDAQKEIKELRDKADSATDDNRAEREKALYEAELEVVEAIDAVRAMEDNEVQTHMMEHPEVAYYINKDIEQKVKGNVKELQKAIARKEPDARKALSAYRKTPEYKYYNQIRRILKRIRKLESRLKDETKNIAPSQRVKMKQKIDGHKKELVELRKAYESIGEIKE